VQVNKLLHTRLLRSFIFLATAPVRAITASGDKPQAAIHDKVDYWHKGVQVHRASQRAGCGLKEFLIEIASVAPMNNAS
jgi:hypothetical protein